MESVAQHSREMIQRGSRSFSAAAALFDKSTRKDVEMLYAWCRHCDDVIDGQVLGHRQGAPGDVDPQALQDRLDELRRQTRAAHAGAAMTDPVFAAFQSVVQKHDLPLRYALDLLDGFAMDVAERRYETLSDTLEYCYHVAGVVGVMMAHIMGVRDEQTLQRACDLGLAFQLTNIARDIVEDAENDRVYLPAKWLAAEDVPVNAVADPANREAVYRIAERLIREADRYYDSASVGIARLGFRSAWAISAAQYVYRAIGTKVIARGPAAWDTRTSTSGARKVAAVAYGFIRAAWRQVSKPDDNANPRLDMWTKANLSEA